MRSSTQRICSVALALTAAFSIAACSGGGGGSTPVITPTNSPQSNLVTPTFFIIVPLAPSAHARKPQVVSSSTQSITVTLTLVNGGAPAVTPTSVTTNISGASCSSGCTVNGPPSPPGVPDTYQVTTYDAQNGGGNALDQGSVTFTPTAGQNNVANLTLNGIPYSVTITGVPTTWQADTSGQTQALTVTVKDHAGATITGTYANQVVITDPDTQLTNGTTLTGTNVDGSCVSDSCVDMKTSTDTITFNYGGLAENPVTLASSGTGLGTAGTATFTPLLNAIAYSSGPTSAAGGKGVDLFTTNSSATLGYSGTEAYSEAGFTDSPYNMQLSVTGTGACSGFATVSRGANASGATPFTATTTSTPSAGSCTLTVTDSLTDQTNALPTFVVTYTISSLSGSSKYRRP
jgi:hypothetical protein